jgi:hypothetical protein
LTPAVCGEEDPTGPHALESTPFHNSVATVNGPRESVCEVRRNVQPAYPLRGFLRLEPREDVNRVFSALTLDSITSETREGN